jgi:hypothetical protein
MSLLVNRNSVYLLEKFWSDALLLFSWKTNETIAS